MSAPKSAKETLREKRQHANWHRLLVKPIYLADGKVLFTLKDAAVRVLAVPASSSSRVAAERILNAALHGGDMASTHVAVRLALREDIKPSANQKLPRPGVDQIAHTSRRAHPRLTTMIPMSALKLVPAHENRSTGSWSPDDFDVVLIETGEAVGRICGRPNARGTGTEWFWGLGFPHTLNAKQLYYGLAESKEAAKQAFAERWRDHAPIL